MVLGGFRSFHVLVTTFFSVRTVFKILPYSIILKRSLLLPVTLTIKAFIVTLTKHKKELFYLQCLEQYVLFSISNGNVLKLPCPDALCRKSGQLTTNEVSKRGLAELSFHLLVHFIF